MTCLGFQETLHKDLAEPRCPWGLIALHFHVGSSFPARGTSCWKGSSTSPHHPPQHSCVPRLLVALWDEKRFFFSMFCRAFGQQACKLLMQERSNVEPLISSPHVLRYGKPSTLLGVALVFLVQCDNSKQLCEGSSWAVGRVHALCAPFGQPSPSPVNPAAVVCARVVGTQRCAASVSPRII